MVPHQNFASAHLHHRTAHSYEFSAPRWHDFSSVGDGECDGADAWFDCKKAADPPRCTTTGPPPHGAALTQLGAAENVGGGHNGRLQARAGAVAAGRGKAAFFAFQIFGALLLTPRHLRARSTTCATTVRRQSPSQVTQSLGGRAADERSQHGRFASWWL